jgi:cell division septum initiation protein DivIVA
MTLKSIEEEAADCRSAWGAQQDATAGLHIHHEIVAELLTEPIETRIAYILSDKPKAEQALRLRLMRPLPAEAWAEYKHVEQAAWEEYERVRQPACAEYNRVKQAARAEYTRVEQAAREEYKRVEQSAREEYNRVRQPAREEYDRVKQAAREEYNRVRQHAREEYERVKQAARAEYTRVEQAALEALHAHCIEGCPWDGSTIFPQAVTA